VAFKYLKTLNIFVLFLHEKLDYFNIFHLHTRHNQLINLYD